MSNTQHKGAEEQIPGERSSAGPMAVEMVAGAAAGALVGALAGPPGAAVGALIGGAVGAAAAVATERSEHEKQAHEEQLDRDIGVIGGTIGEPSLQHPPPSHGLFHADTLGVASGGMEASDGPMQNVDASE